MKQGERQLPITTEQKAAAYDKAVEKIKYVIEHGVSPVLNKKDLQDIFPQLKESEDEKIRKALIEYFTAYPKDYYCELKKSHILAWLEKKGELSSWSEEDEHRVKDTIYFLDTAKKHYASAVELDACIDWLKSLKGRYTWKPSKEQMQQLGWIAEQNENNMIGKELASLYQDLKKLEG